jgi:small subunit ribosomal protein S7
MPRRAAAALRPIEPDPMYGSKLVQQVINKVMVDGKKSTAEQRFSPARSRPIRSTGRCWSPR